jgi:hypothetical protein
MPIRVTANTAIPANQPNATSSSGSFTLSDTGACMQENIMHQHSNVCCCMLVLLRHHLDKLCMVFSTLLWLLHLKNLVHARESRCTACAACHRKCCMCAHLHCEHSLKLKEAITTLPTLSIFVWKNSSGSASRVILGLSESSPPNCMRVELHLAALRGNTLAVCNRAREHAVDSDVGATKPLLATAC